MSSDCSKAPTLLVIDDDPDVLAVVDRFASELGFTVIQETNGQAALRSLPITKPDGAIIDVDLADIDGLSMLREIKAADPTSQVILMTNAATVDSAIEAIKAGALDYITKPFDIDRLRELLITVRKSMERRETLLRIDADVARQFEFYGLIGRSPVMQELFDSDRARDRRNGHRERTGRQGAPSSWTATRKEARHGQLLRGGGNAVRERIVWTYARRVHRCDRHQGRPLRARA
jgi:DNA-binding response OmpR family regulator